MVHADLQVLIDDLATRFGAPTMLEDPDQRVIVYSAHGDSIDEVRRDSILRRETTPGTKAWFRRYGILQAVEPVRIPCDPDAGVLGRLCVPVRYRSRLMGFLWVIDDRERLDIADMAAVMEIAEHVGLMLYEEELTRRWGSDLLARLLSPSVELREAALQHAADPSLLDSHFPCAIVVLQPLGLDERPHPDISETLWEIARRSRSAHHDLHLSYGDHGVLLVRLRTVEDDSRATTIAREAREALLGKLDKHRSSCRVVAAVGDAQNGLIKAASSYRQAVLAAKVAQALPSVGDLPRWRDLGVFRTLVQLPMDDTTESALDPRLALLLHCGDEQLVGTLETYLDLACDAKATAAYLHLHRGTLYYRLQKAQRMGGIDLRDGHDRLAIHLGFKLARLIGLWQATMPGDASRRPG